MATKKPPVSFLSLARELRQKILIESYQYDETTPWTAALHNQQWTATLIATLTAIHPNLTSDVQYADTKAVEAMVTAAEQHWSRIHPWGIPSTQFRGTPIMTEANREMVWNVSRGGLAPWTKMCRKLYLKNQKWWYEGGGEAGFHAVMKELSPDSFRNARAERDADLQFFPSWDRHCRNRDIHRRVEYDEAVADWPGGASGVAWDKTGLHHPPSTWDKVGDVSGSVMSLKEAADVDIAWLQAQ